MGYNLPINGVYWGYNPFTNFLGHPSIGVQVVLRDEVLHSVEDMALVALKRRPLGAWRLRGEVFRLTFFGTRSRYP